MHQQVRQNPPWAVKVLKMYWPRLQQAAKQLPGPMKGAMPVSPIAEEFGCGFFGCVFPTNKPGIVFKLTKDRNEAQFVSWLLKHDPKGKKYPGILRHYKIIKLDVGQQTLDAFHLSMRTGQPSLTPCPCEQCVGYPLNAGPVWAIWREEVIRSSMPVQPWRKAGMDTLLSATRAVFWYAREGKVTKKTVQRAAKIASMPSDKRPMNSSPEVMLAAVEVAAKRASASRPLKQVGRAVLDILKKHHILMNDLHCNNIGLVVRGTGNKTKTQWVVSDPGEVIWLPGAKLREPKRRLARK